jgi:MATE family multidrug resistance protein
MALLYMYAETGLRSIGEPEESIPNAVAFVNTMLLGLPFVAVYYTLNRGLQAAGIVLPILAIVLAVKSSAVLFVYWELFSWQMSIIAVAWTLSTAAVVQAIAVYVYMRSAGIITAWFGTDEYAEPTYTPWSQAFRGLAAYAWLAIPAAIAVCLEFWLFDLVGMLAGLLPNAAVELSTHYLLFSCCFACYMLFSGLSVGVSVVVGCHMGVPGESTLAYRSAVVGLCACATVSATFMLMLVFLHDQLGRALTSDEAILQRFTECVPVLVTYTAVDGLNTCATQLLRTLGVQNYSVLLHFATYYLCGVTSGYLLATAEATQLGVVGLWIGLCIGVGLNASIATIWLWRTDWRKQCEDAIQRAVEDRMAHSASSEALIMMR